MQAGYNVEPARPRWILREVIIVLSLSLGASAVYSIIEIIQRVLTPTPLAQQTAAMNGSLSRSQYFDLTLQLLSIATMLAPVALCLFLVAQSGRNPTYSLRAATRQIGAGLKPFPNSVGWGFALAAAIGIPGLGLYAVGRALGFTVTVQAATLDAFWWTIPILIMRAAANGILEEVIMVGYLMERLPLIGGRWFTSRWGAALTSAVIRGSYHLYQGFGAFVGNIVMGLLFTEFYRRTKRTAPLVIAHTILDMVAFVGYALLKPHWTFLQ